VRGETLSGDAHKSPPGVFLHTYVRWVCGLQGEGYPISVGSLWEMDFSFSQKLGVPYPTSTLTKKVCVLRFTDCVGDARPLCVGSLWEMDSPLNREFAPRPVRGQRKFCELGCVRRRAVRSVWDPSGPSKIENVSPDLCTDRKSCVHLDPKTARGWAVRCVWDPFGRSIFPGYWIFPEEMDFPLTLTLTIPCSGPSLLVRAGMVFPAVTFPMKRGLSHTLSPA